MGVFHRGIQVATLWTSPTMPAASRRIQPAADRKITTVKGARWSGPPSGVAGGRPTRGVSPDCVDGPRERAVFRPRRLG